MGGRSHRIQRSVVRDRVATYSHQEERRLAEHRSALGHLQSPIRTTQLGPPPFSGIEKFGSLRALGEGNFLKRPESDHLWVRCRFVPATLDLVLAAAVTLLAAAIQGTVGLGFAVFSVPILTLIDPELTPIPQLFVALPISISAAWRERHHLDLSGLGWIVGGRIPGAMLGAWILQRVAEPTLDTVIALIVLGAVAALASGLTIRMNRSTRTAAGFASGFTGTTSAIGGPPIALLYQRSTSATIRSSLGTVFAIGIVINLAVLGASGAVEPMDLRLAGLLVLPALFGFAVSSKAKHLMEGPRIRQAILLVAAFAAVALLVRGLSG